MLPHTKLTRPGFAAWALANMRPPRPFQPATTFAACFLITLKSFKLALRWWLAPQ